MTVILPSLLLPLAPHIVVNSRSYTLSQVWLLGLLVSSTGYVTTQYLQCDIVIGKLARRQITNLGSHRLTLRLIDNEAPERVRQAIGELHVCGGGGRGTDHRASLVEERPRRQRVWL